MAGINGISAYQQINQTWNNSKKKADDIKAAPSKSDQTGSAKEASAPKVEVKAWSPLSSTSSLIPQKTEYGNAIGDVQLSDKAKEYYSKLKGQFHNLDFIAVSKDMKSQVAQNAAAYGNPNKMVVLIDEEKLERMATDESYRKKYEGIIAMSQSKLTEAKNSLMSSGASIKNFGMSVDSNGKESFFATVEKSLNMQKKRIEKKAEEKKQQKIQEKKKAEKEAREEKLEKAREESKADQAEKENTEHDDKEYLMFESDSMERLIDRIGVYSFDHASNHVMTDAEKAIGWQIDFKG